MTFWTQLKALKAVGMPVRHAVKGVTGRQRKARAKRRKAARVGSIKSRAEALGDK